MAAAALLAVSAGACFGVALSFTPAATSMYTAPAAVRTISRVSAVNMPRMEVVSAQYGAQQMAQQAAQNPVALQASVPMAVNPWTVISSGVVAAAAAVVAIMYKYTQSESSEQVAMLAASGKKAAPKAAKNSTRELWYPTAEAPAWLDGSLPGDRGFDPLGLSKPTEFVQYDLDGLDQNAPKNPVGRPIASIAPQPDQLTGDAFQPYSEVFGLYRFRECELIHGRWAMLAVLGCLVGEAVSGVPWQNAGLYEVTNGANYFGYSLPFTISQVAWFQALTIGGVEILRNRELDSEKRIYPGGNFDPLGLAAKDDAATRRLKEAELKHSRLAMLAILGFAAAAGRTGLGATEGFSQWAISSFV